MNKLAYIAATVLTAIATFSVSTASLWFVYQGETPEELLTK